MSNLVKTLAVFFFLAIAYGMSATPLVKTTDFQLTFNGEQINLKDGISLLEAGNSQLELLLDNSGQLDLANNMTVTLASGRKAVGTAKFSQSAGIINDLIAKAQAGDRLIIEVEGEDGVRVFVLPLR